jgi:hypothetical protein
MDFLHRLFGGGTKEPKAEAMVLAVMAIGERDGSTRFMDEDGTGKSFNLQEVNQPALLVVPRDTLPHLQADQ